jgi:hypothetical protein
MNSAAMTQLNGCPSLSQTMQLSNVFSGPLYSLKQVIDMLELITEYCIKVQVSPGFVFAKVLE